MDEKALIAAAQRGETAAFNRLVLQYQDMVYSVAYRIMGGPHAASDATQEAFISAYRGLGRFRGGSFKAWLMRIVSNACYDELRRQKRHPQSSLDALYVEDPPSASLPRSPAESPEEHVERQEVNRLLQSGIAQLPHDQRMVLVLSDVEGLSYEEVSQAMGVPRGTVKSRLHRARARLREYLLDHGELLPLQYRLSSGA